MKLKILFVTTVSFCLFLLPTVEAQQPEKQLPSATEVKLEAKIVSAAEPDTVKIHRPFGPPYLGDDEAPQSQRWLYLRVEIDVPKEGTWVAVKSIRVTDDSSTAYPALGIGMGKPIGKDDIFYLFKNVGDSSSGRVGVGHSDEKGLVFTVLDMKGELGISLMKKQPVEMRLLFAVPDAVKRLHLQIGEGRKILVPIR